MSDQLSPCIAPDGLGGAFIAWADLEFFGPGFYLQHITSDGETTLGTGVPLSVPHSSLTSPDIAPDGNGGVYVCWGSDDWGGGYAIFLQHVTAGGSVSPGWPAGGLVVSVIPALVIPHMVSDGAGGALVLWSEGSSLKLQRYTSTASVFGWPLGGALVSSAQGFGAPQLVSDGAGGAIVAWTRTGANNGDIYMQHIYGNGSRLGWPLDGILLAGGPAAQGGVHLASDGSGGAIFEWFDERNLATSGRDIYAARIHGDASLATGWVVAGGRPVCTAPGAQDLATLAADGAGGAFFVWTDRRADSAGDLYAMRFTDVGTPASGWTADGVKFCGAPGLQSVALQPLVPDGTGGTLIVWKDQRDPLTGTDIFVHRVLSDGTPAPGWPADGLRLCGAPKEQSGATAAPNGLGGAIVTWQDHRFLDFDIYAARINPDGSTPILASLVSADATAERVRLVWNDPAGNVLTASVWRSAGTSEWSAIGDTRMNGKGDLEFEDRDIAPGGRYGYRLRSGDTWFGEVWIEVPAAAALSLRAVTPAEGGSIRVMLSLPTASAATLDLFDVRGRCLESRALEPAAGSRVTGIGTRETLSAGVYFVRLAQEGRSVIAKAVVAR